MSEMPPVDPTLPPLPSAPPRPEGLPWEEPNAGLGSLFPTIGQFITSPFTAYARMNLTVDLVRPIAYFVLFVLAGAVVSQIWSAIFWDSMVGLVRGFLPPQIQQLMTKPTVIQITLGIVIAPLFGLILLFIWSGLVHLVLMMLGGAASGYAATLRVVCYARTAEVAAAVPVAGGLIGFVWCRVLEIIGLSRAHRTDGWKAALAVVVPFALCCMCVVGGAVAFSAAIAQAVQQQMK